MNFQSSLVHNAISSQILNNVNTIPMQLCCVWVSLIHSHRAIIVDCTAGFLETGLKLLLCGIPEHKRPLGISKGFKDIQTTAQCTTCGLEQRPQKQVGESKRVNMFLGTLEILFPNNSYAAMLQISFASRAFKYYVSYVSSEYPWKQFLCLFAQQASGDTDALSVWHSSREADVKCLR